MTDGWNDFVEESAERITRLNNELLAIERDPGDEEAMRSVFRVAHTLKGNAGAAGFDAVSDLAHALEDLLDAVRAGRLEVTAELMDLAFDAVDELEAMVREVAVDGEVRSDPNGTIREIRAFVDRETKRGATAVDPPTAEEIDAVVSSVEVPADEETDAFLVRFAIREVDAEGVTNGERVLGALVDAFDVLGTHPGRRSIEGGTYGGRFDAVFASAVGEAAIVAALEPIDEVADFEIVDVTDRVAAIRSAGSNRADVPAEDISTDDARDLGVDELLEEFDEFDDLDEKVKEVEDDEDLEVFDEMGDAGAFDDLFEEAGVEPDVAGEDPAAPTDGPASGEDASATEDADEVDDAEAVFAELKEEVEPVGFEELTAELEELEFDEFGEEEIGMDELLGDVDESETDDAGEPSEDAADDGVVGPDDERVGADDSTADGSEPDAVAATDVATVDDQQADVDDVATADDQPVDATGVVASDEPVGGSEDVTEPETAPPADGDGVDATDAADPTGGVETGPATAGSSPGDTASASEGAEAGDVDETWTVDDVADSAGDDVTATAGDSVGRESTRTDDAPDAASAAGEPDHEAATPDEEPIDANEDADPSQAEREFESAESVAGSAAPSPDEADATTDDGVETPDPFAEGEWAPAGTKADDPFGTEVDDHSGTKADVPFAAGADAFVDGAVDADEASSETGSFDHESTFEPPVDSDAGFGDALDDSDGEFDDGTVEESDGEFDDAFSKPGDDFGDESDPLDASATTTVDWDVGTAGEPFDESDDGWDVGFDDADPGTPEGPAFAESTGADASIDDDSDETSDLGTDASIETFESVDLSSDPIDLDGDADESFEETFGTDALSEVDDGWSDADEFTSAESGTDRSEGAFEDPQPIVEEPSLEIPDITVPETSDRSTDGTTADEITSVRVDVEQIDELLALVEGLVTTRVRLRHAVETDLDREVLETEVDGLDSLVTDLQGTVMDVRLVPVETVANRLPRIVRDVARDQGKRVDFEMTGTDVELDRGILDRLRDPLVHLVRNAVDHGIEPPEERTAAGKPETGRVEVAVGRTRGQVTIAVSDDGRGLDPDDLRSAAVDAGVLSDAEAANTGDEAALDLAFHPGLSTTDEVTDVSGRGVGMDVVERTVDDLEGTISIDSEVGEGTTVTMTLPVSIAIDDVLFVECGGEEFGIPTTAVQDIEPVEAVETVDGEPVLPVDGGSYPVISLDEALETPSQPAEDGMVVRIREDVRPVALRCDRVSGQQEVVVKPYEGFMGDVPGLSGATVRGRGAVVNILDVTTL